MSDFSNLLTQDFHSLVRKRLALLGPWKLAQHKEKSFLSAHETLLEVAWSWEQEQLKPVTSVTTDLDTKAPPEARTPHGSQQRASRAGTDQPLCGHLHVQIESFISSKPSCSSCRRSSVQNYREKLEQPTRAQEDCSGTSIGLCNSPQVSLKDDCFAQFCRVIDKNSLQLCLLWLADDISSPSVSPWFLNTV